MDTGGYRREEHTHFRKTGPTSVTGSKTAVASTAQKRADGNAVGRAGTRPYVHTWVVGSHGLDTSQW